MYVLLYVPVISQHKMISFRNLQLHIRGLRSVVVIHFHEIDPQGFYPAMSAVGETQFMIVRELPVYTEPGFNSYLVVCIEHHEVQTCIEIHLFCQLELRLGIELIIPGMIIAFHKKIGTIIDRHIRVCCHIVFVL